jgi:hypothetical protein
MFLFRQLASNKLQELTSTLPGLRYKLEEVYRSTMRRRPRAYKKTDRRSTEKR